MLIPNRLRTNYELLRLNNNDITVRNTIQTTIKFEHTLSSQLTTTLEPTLEYQGTTLTSVRVYKNYFIFNTKENSTISNIMKTYKAYFHYTDIYTIEVSSVHLINTNITHKGVQ